jgi:hypothetical protein
MKLPLLPILLLVVAGCKPAENSTANSEQPSSTQPGGNPLTAPVDYLGATAKGKKIGENTAALAPVLQAIQQFHTVEDRYPADLAELVKAGFLARVPVAAAGQRLDYNPATGTVRIVAAQ